MPSVDPRLSRFPHVCVVDASAGSGKTYALATRYIQLLMSSGASAGSLALRSILAVTFSNRASLEMKERILDLLKKIALGHFRDDEERKELLNLLPVSCDEAKERSRALLDYLVRNYNTFQVQTIDSFINAILSGCAFKIDLSTHFKIRTDQKEYLRLSLDMILDQASTDKKLAVLWRDFLHHYLYLENHSGWFPKKEIFEQAVGLYNQVNIYGVGFGRLSLTAQDVARQKKEFLRQVRQLADILPLQTHKKFAASLAALAQSAQERFDLDDLSDYFLHEEFPARKGAVVEAEVCDAWVKIRRSLALIADAESLTLDLPYVAVFDRLMKAMSGFSRRDDVLFLEELNRQARSLFEEGSLTVPELYYRLAMRLRHYLVDEFQDTSRLQWKNLRAMIEESLSSGGSLFYVGDKKQAIYRFRGGDASLFDELKDDLAAFGVFTTALQKNRRSLPAVVDFVNRLFSRDNLKRFLQEREAGARQGSVLSLAAQEAVLKIFEGAAQEKVRHERVGYVKAAVIPVRDKEERDQRIEHECTAIIAQLTERFRLGDIAVLVRENDDVELVSSWLMSRGVAVASEKTLDIRNHPYIKEVISLLRFLSSPIDDLAFASFILGDVFSRATGKQAQEMHDFLFGLRDKKSASRAVYFYREFRHRYLQIWEEYFEELFRSVGFVPLYELLVSLYRRFGCLELFGDDQAFFMRLLELVKEQEEEHNSLASFLDFFASDEAQGLYLKMPKTDAVHVLTIHKAKGLGFAAVVVPFLELKTRVAPAVTCVGEEGLFLRRIAPKYRSYAPAVAELYAQEYLRSLIDELDAVYVALTRAREELYVFLPQSLRQKSQSLHSLVPPDCFEMGAPDQARVVRKESERPILPPSACRDWIQVLQEEFGDPHLLERRDKILRGEVLHDILSGLADLDGQDLEPAMDAALSSARSRFPHFKEWAFCREAVMALLRDEKMKPFFWLEGAELYREQEMVNRQGRILRVDRLVVTPEAFWVVDYKSSDEARPEHAQQVRDYKEVLRDIYPGKTPRGFLVYIDTHRVLEVS